MTQEGPGLQEGVSCKKDMIFADNGRALRWDVYRPEQVTGQLPAVLIFHGGAWEVGDRTHVAQAGQAFAARGFVALCAEYRLLGEAPWPGQLLDTRTAIRAARADAADLGIDPDAIFLAGFSAGAHLALLAASGASTAVEPGQIHAGVPEAVAGVAAYFPPARLSPGDAERLGLTDANDIAQASPTAHAAQLPPTIIFCGDNDAITPHHLSVELFETIRAAGGESDLRLFGGLIHEFVRLPNMLDTTVRDAVEFFDRTALSRDAFGQAFEELSEWWRQILAGHAPH